MTRFLPRLITSREEAAERSLDAFEIMSAKQFHAGKIRDVIENLRSQLADTTARREKLEIEARSCREQETEYAEIITAYEQMQERLG